MVTLTGLSFIMSPLGWRAWSPECLVVTEREPLITEHDEPEPDAREAALQARRASHRGAIEACAAGSQRPSFPWFTVAALREAASV